MDCKQAIEYIHSLERFGIMPGLERIEHLCKRLGEPQKGMKFIHVAGTNGKGSTSTFTSNILIDAGYTVGLYTSPYVVDFRERIQINGEMIEPDELAYCVEKVKETVEEDEIKATEFEVITAAAFLCFKRQKCDYVVLEVGLGGRFDATNVIDAPAACAIVSVSLDHMAILGNTVTEIAGEKCGIIKEGTKVISYPLQNKEALSVIEKTCLEKNVPLIIPDLSKLKIETVESQGSEAEYDGMKIQLNLPGEHMIYNSITAAELVKATAPDVTKENIENGIRKTRMAARIETKEGDPFLILDGGHNEDCGNALKKYLETHKTWKKLIMVTSMMADKDCESYLSSVAPFADVFIATRADVPRAMDAGELCTLAGKYCENRFSVPVASSAVRTAKAQAEKGDAIIVCGSFYLAGEIRNILFEGDNNNG